MPINPNPFKDINKVTIKDLDDELQIKIGLIDGMSGDLGNIYPGATKVENLGDGKIKINDVEQVVYKHPSSHPATMITGLHAIATSGQYTDLVGAPTELPASDVYPWAKAPTKPLYTPSEVGAMAANLKGTPNGVADLDIDGRVPAKELPPSLEYIANSGTIDPTYIPNINLATNATDDAVKVVVLGGLNSSLMQDLTGGGLPPVPPKPVMQTTLNSGLDEAIQFNILKGKNLSEFKRSNTSPTEADSAIDWSLDKNNSFLIWGVEDPKTPNTMIVYWYSTARTIYLNPDCRSMFKPFDTLATLDLSAFNFSKVTDARTMLAIGPKFTSLNITGWSTNNKINANQMFFGDSNLTVTGSIACKDNDLSNLFLDVTKYYDSNGSYQMFKGCSKDLIHQIFPSDNPYWDFEGTYIEAGILDDGVRVNNTIKTNATGITSFKRSLSAPAQGITTYSISRSDSKYPIVIWKDTTDPKIMFYHCEVSRILLMNGNSLFYNLPAFTNIIMDFSWENVSDVSHMLSGLTSLETLGLCSNVQHAINLTTTAFMFERSKSPNLIEGQIIINQDNLRNLDKDNGSNSTYYMFNGLSAADRDIFSTSITGLDYTKFNSEGTYVPFAPAETTLLSGAAFVDTLARSNPDVYKGKSFTRFTTIPSSVTNTIDISEAQDRSIVAWMTVDTTSPNNRVDVGWYSKFDKVCLNPDSSQMFSTILLEMENLDLHDFSFDKVVNADSMLSGGSYTTLNITGWKATSLQTAKHMFEYHNNLTITGSITEATNMLNLDKIDDTNGTYCMFGTFIPKIDFNTIFPLSGGEWNDLGTYITVTPPPTLIEITNFNWVSEHFARSTVAPASTITATDMSVNQDKSILFWNDKESNTLYWYSPFDKVYLNPNCNMMGYYLFTNKNDTIDLSDFMFDKVKTASHMFDKVSANTINITGWRGVSLENCDTIFGYIAGPVNIIGSIEMVNMHNLSPTLDPKEIANKTMNALQNISNPDSVILLQGGSWDREGTYIVGGGGNS